MNAINEKIDSLKAAARAAGVAAAKLPESERDEALIKAFARNVRDAWHDVESNKWNAAELTVRLNTMTEKAFERTVSEATAAN